MFSHAGFFNQPLNNWNVSKVEDMDFMFAAATSFNQPLNNWNVLTVRGTQTLVSFAPLAFISCFAPLVRTLFSPLALSPR